MIFRSSDVWRSENTCWPVPLGFLANSYLSIVEKARRMFFSDIDVFWNRLFFSRYTHDLVRLAACACGKVMNPEVGAYPAALSVTNC